MPRDFVFEKESDFIGEAEKVDAPKYVTYDGSVVRAFFPGRWWLNVYEVQIKDQDEVAKVKGKFVEKGFTPITIRESPIKVF